MLILPDGSHVGTISGGCLEKDLCRQAASITKDGPTLLSFDTRSESTNFTPRYNLGCSGILYVLMERVTSHKECPLASVRAVLANGEPRIVGTVYESVNNDFPVGMRISEFELQRMHPEFRSLVAEIEARRTPICCQLMLGNCTTRIFIERISPPMPWLVFGAGDDAIPLARIAREMGWEVTVVDDRADRLTRNRFPNVDRLVFAAMPEVPTRVQVPPDACAVIMTHSFSKDVVLLPWLLKSEAGFVGLLGPKSRTGRILKKLYSQQALPDRESLNKLHTPVGLDIGATTPAEIALSIVGEVIAWQRGRSGGSLASRSEPIHHPVSHRLIELQQTVEFSANSP
jgi:xanthine/CO dehydrogenase XdhC/CoxF family maturation factor